MDTQAGWGAVISGGGWPSAILGGVAIVGAIVRGPSIMRLIGRDWKNEAGKEREEIDADRKELREEKDRELDRLRAEVVEKREKIDKLYERIAKLMRAIYYWRDLCRDYKHGWANERQRHQSYERMSGIDPLVDGQQIQDVPSVSEESDAFLFKPES